MSIFSVRQSKIHGRGCFTNVNLPMGCSFPVPYWVTSEETHYTLHDLEGGMYELYNPFKFLNDSDAPNASLYWKGDDLYLAIIEDIKAGHEVVINYDDS